MGLASEKMKAIHWLIKCDLDVAKASEKAKISTSRIHNWIKNSRSFRKDLYEATIRTHRKNINSRISCYEFLFEEIRKELENQIINKQALKSVDVVLLLRELSRASSELRNDVKIISPDKNNPEKENQDNLSKLQDLYSEHEEKENVLAFRRNK